MWVENPNRCCSSGLHPILCSSHSEDARNPERAALKKRRSCLRAPAAYRPERFRTIQRYNLTRSSRAPIHRLVLRVAPSTGAEMEARRFGHRPSPTQTRHSPSNARAETLNYPGLTFLFWGVDNHKPVRINVERFHSAQESTAL